MKEKEMMATMSGKQDEQRITSLDIAAVTGKMHKHVLQAIRRPPSHHPHVARLGEYGQEIKVRRQLYCSRVHIYHK